MPLLIKQLLVYHQYTLFEEHYVEVACKFYEEESERLSRAMQDDAPGFFRHMRLRLEEEVKRAKMMLPVGSWNLVRKVTEQALWTNRIDWLANASKYLHHRPRGSWLTPTHSCSYIYGTRGYRDAWFHVYLVRTRRWRQGALRIIQEVYTGAALLLEIDLLLIIAIRLL